MEVKNKNIIPLGVTIGGYSFEAPALKEGFTTVEGVMDIVVFGLNTLVGLAALVAVAMIIYSGFTFITAAGDPEKVQKGSGALTASIIGLIIVFIARIVVVFLLENILV
ncbi:MAG: hypothetical protein WC981_00315 [Candidatus Dojkabacteria bacterium]